MHTDIITSPASSSLQLSSYASSETWAKSTKKLVICIIVNTIISKFVVLMTLKMFHQHNHPLKHIGMKD